MPLNPDRQIFFVLCRYGSGLAWAERDVARTDRATTLSDIVTGDLTDIVQIIELNVAEFSSRDVTEDMLAEAALESAQQRPLFGQDLIDWRNDHRRDREKNWIGAL